MFTRATQSFGNWRDGHASLKFAPSLGNQSLLVAIGVCAFVCWLTFFISLKIYSEFFVLESQQLDLVKSPISEGLLAEARPAALRLALSPMAGNQIQVIFETGEKFSFPEDKNRIEMRIRKRVDEMVMTGLLTLIANPAISRAQIWADQRASQDRINELLVSLTQIGFDDFDFAFEVN